MNQPEQESSLGSELNSGWSIVGSSTTLTINADLSMSENQDVIKNNYIKPSFALFLALYVAIASRFLSLFEDFIVQTSVISVKYWINNSATILCKTIDNGYALHPTEQ